MSNRDETAIELLIIERSLDAAENYVTTLRNAGIAVHPHRADKGKPLTDALADPSLDLILCSADTEKSDFNAKIELCRGSRPDIPVVVVYQDQDPDVLLQALKSGARDVVATADGEHLQLVVKREFKDLLIRRELEQTRALLRETESRCASLIDNSRDAIAYVHEGMHILANPAYLAMFGHEEMEDLEGLPVLDMIAPDDHAKFKGFLRAQGEESTRLEVRCRHSKGEIFDALLEFSSASIEGESCTQITIRGADQARGGQTDSFLDPHTGLANRQRFFECINTSIAAKADSQETGWLFYIVVDDFQQIRTSIGIAASDDLLKEFAGILSGVAGEGVELARFGDHTFTLLAQSATKQEAEQLAARIHARVLEHDFAAKSGVMDATCSIGIARVTGETANGQEALNHAYHASEAARQKDNGGTTMFYSEQTPPPAEEEAGSETQLNRLIQHALKNDRFRLVYQPIVSLEGESRETYAVMTRLLDNNDEEILPEYFMNTAEQQGLMRDIDRWVILHAIRELVSQRGQGRKVNFFISLSASTLKDSDFLVWICDRIREESAKGAWFTFQINSEVIRSHLREAKALMEGLRKIKCLLAIDQYGLSEKAEAMLKHLPVDYVKYDPSLIEGLSKSQEKQDRLSGLNEKVHDHDIKSIALGVEDANSMAVLWNIGVDYIQGYFLQEPSESMFYEF